MNSGRNHGAERGRRGPTTSESRPIALKWRQAPLIDADEEEHDHLNAASTMGSEVAEQYEKFFGELDRDPRSFIRYAA